MMTKYIKIDNPINIFNIFIYETVCGYNKRQTEEINHIMFFMYVWGAITTALIIFLLSYFGVL